MKNQASRTQNMAKYDREKKYEEASRRYNKICQNNTNLMVHILVSSYTASNPWFTDWEKWTTLRPAKFCQLAIPE